MFAFRSIHALDAAQQLTQLDWPKLLLVAQKVSDTGSLRLKPKVLLHQHRCVCQALSKETSTLCPRGNDHEAA